MTQHSTDQSRPRPPSPSQTIGPFFHDVVALTGSNDTDYVARAGESIRIVGRVLDGAGVPVDDALVELWQPEATGDRDTKPGQAPAIAAGFARSGTEDEGRFSFKSIKPPMRADGTAPFILVRILGRGLLRSLITRIYFEDHDNGQDPVLRAIDRERRETLVATRDETTDPPTYRFDIRLQGERETVFFELQPGPS